MIPILNALNVNTSVYGNHDFGMWVFCNVCAHVSRHLLA